MRAAGAREWGQANTAVLTSLHGLFYLGCVLEAIFRGARPDAVAAAGALLYLGSILVLLVVWRKLEGFWTVKLLLASGHRLNRSWLFRRVRHPNYFFNLLPELAGLALVGHAAWTAALVLPPYLISLAVRIRQEEAGLREKFAEYGA